TSPCRAAVWAIVLATAPYLSSARPAPSPSPPTSPAAAPAFAPIRNPEFAKKKSATSVDAAAAAGAARSAPRARAEATEQVNAWSRAEGPAASARRPHLLQLQAS